MNGLTFEEWWHAQRKDFWGNPKEAARAVWEARGGAMSDVTPALVERLSKDSCMDYPGHAKKLEAENAELRSHLQWALTELKEKALHTMQRSDMMGRHYVCRYCGSSTEHAIHKECPYYDAERALLAKHGAADAK